MNEFLITFLYVLGSILLVVLIILGIKLIMLTDKVDKTIDNVNTKINAFNGFFDFFDLASNRFSFITDRITDGITSLVKRIFNKKEEEENDE